MPFVNLENGISDEEFYKVCCEELANVSSYPISDEEKWKFKCTIYDTVLKHEEGKETRAELKRDAEQIGKSLDILAGSFSSILEYAGKISDEVAGIAETSAQISTQIKETNKNLRKATETAYECQDNLKEARYNLDDAQDKLEETRKDTKKIGKNFEKMGDETERIKKEYEGKLAAKDAIIEIGNGMRSQSKQ
jgi:chromosome segregation ATPase